MLSTPRGPQHWRAAQAQVCPRQVQHRGSTGGAALRRCGAALELPCRAPPAALSSAVSWPLLEAASMESTVELTWLGGTKESAASVGGQAGGWAGR